MSDEPCWLVKKFSSDKKIIAIQSGNNEQVWRVNIGLVWDRGNITKLEVVVLVFE